MVIWQKISLIFEYPADRFEILKLTFLFEMSGSKFIESVFLTEDGRHYLHVVKIFRQQKIFL